jgi:hypothetical protein
MRRGTGLTGRRGDSASQHTDHACREMKAVVQLKEGLPAVATIDDDQLNSIGPLCNRKRDGCTASRKRIR